MRSILHRLDESSRRERRDEDEVLDVPVSPRHRGAPHELQCHCATKASVLDEARQLPKVAEEDLGRLAGHRWGVAEVVGRPKEGVAVVVPDPLQLLPEDLEAPVPAQDRAN